MFLANDYSDSSVCVMGLGYVGMTLAATMADVGFDVLGVEIRDEVLASLKRGEPHFFEPGLREMLARINKCKNLKLAKQLTSNIDPRVFIITVGTPLGDDGRSRLDMIENISHEVASVLRDGDMVIMRSTVKIGTTRSLVTPILDSANVDYDLAFCPERTLEGVALKELRTLPQIVGANDIRSRTRAAQLFQFLTPTVVRVDSWETAEMIKLVDNTQRDVSFAFSNEIARLCDEVGVSASEVIEAGKLGYPRTNLPLPGLVGGPCLAKDSYILAESMEPFGIVPEIAMAARKLNERQPLEVIAKLSEIIASAGGLAGNQEITVAGIAFKGRPETDDLRGTMAVPILKALRAAFPAARLRGFDPIVASAQIEAMGLVHCPTLDSAFEGACLVIIANNHPLYAEMPIDILAQDMAPPGLIFDFWNNFSARDIALPVGTGYIALGARGIGRPP